MVDSLKKGLYAGNAAYHGSTPLRSGIGAIDMDALRKSVNQNLNTATAQRQVLADNATKQALGAYPVSGTSAAAYNYLHGQGGYPVTAVPSNDPVNTSRSVNYGGIYTPQTPTTLTPPPANPPGGPVIIQKPYDTSTGGGTQTKTSTDASTGGTKMTAVNYAAPNMPKPSLLQNLTATLGPLWLGYSVLDKTGGLGQLSKGYDWLTGQFGYNTNPVNLGTASGADLSTFYDAGAGAAAPVNLGTATGSDLSTFYDSGAGAGAGAVDLGTASGSDLSTFYGGADSGAGAGAGAAAAADGSIDLGGGLTMNADGTITGASSSLGGAGATDLTAGLGDTTAGAGASAADAAVGAGAGAGAVDLGTATGADLAAFYDAGAGAAADAAVGAAATDVAGAAAADAGGASFLDALMEFAPAACYITTAATKHGGQKDDGEVLNTLRHFRDTYMRKDAEKNKDVKWYYQNAPRIVNEIDKMPHADAVYQKMYKQFILPAYHAVKDGENERAYKIYKNLVKYAEEHAGLERGKELTPRYGKNGMADGGLSALATGGMSDGHLGGYSDGGRLLRGPGDGVSDSIPATIGGKQPARLADGEFVVPARIVSEIGNGSTEAGARKLYAMMDRVQKARGKTVGKGKVAKNTRADKYLPA